MIVDTIKYTQKIMHKHISWLNYNFSIFSLLRFFSFLFERILLMQKLFLLRKRFSQEGINCRMIMDLFNFPFMQGLHIRRLILKPAQIIRH